ncbi:hypothetical protein [Humidesulfovibrio sp.]
MIRHRCAACGRSINRTDRFFEASDGTLCQDCQLRLAPGRSKRPLLEGFAAAPPLWAVLPELAPLGQR